MKERNRARVSASVLGGSSTRSSSRCSPPKKHSAHTLRGYANDLRFVSEQLAEELGVPAEDLRLGQVTTKTLRAGSAVSTRARNNGGSPLFSPT
jgi:hypothetical protein